MSGTLQLGGTNLAVHSGSGASAKITLDSGLEFPAGHILQVVNNTFTTFTSTTSSTYVDVTGYSADITPSSSSNKVLVMIDACGGGSGSSQVNYAVYAGASLVTETRINRIAGVDYNATISCIHLPSTTSQVTYQIKMKAVSGTGIVNQNTGMTSYITLMELAG